jgi:hypothetical protein
MADTAAHLVDRVSPGAPYRQADNDELDLLLLGD